MSERHRVEVHKFGGTSVGDASRIAAVARIAKDASLRSGIVAVVSAMAGVTDLLVAAGKAAAGGGRDEAIALLQSTLSCHLEALDGLSAGDTAAVGAQIRALIEEALDLVRAVAHLHELTPRTRDDLIATGEKLSARLVTAALHAAGAAAKAVDADTFLETDDAFGEANALMGICDRTTCASLRPILESGAIAVVTGALSPASAQ